MNLVHKQIVRLKANPKQVGNFLRMEGDKVRVEWAKIDHAMPSLVDPSELEARRRGAGYVWEAL